ncbi:DUF4097 family beta strand repeat-containing protein [Streptomyces lydicus]|uniref:DUF4097 family beta strand repeat-containing protein n=1 Tax=Streptomyces lydicus TaxID=47763 RepID=UPI0010123AB8|nr:DUF4097 family beta strand repeat-containing protein [Streptomyces lydicus]MCZ1012055.1 DUF4097 family beta strand repeat-containing protein [Streptomyces lydicus]
MSNFEIVKRPGAQPKNQAGSAERILLAKAAKDGVEPLRTFTGDEQQPGPVLANVTASAATVWVAVDETVTVPMVRVYCSDPDSPYAQAARDTHIQHTGQRLIVTVPAVTVPPRTVRYSGSTYVSGAGSTYSYGMTFSNGVMVDGATAISSGTIVNGHRGIEIELVLPHGSGLHSDTGSGSVFGHGHLAAAVLDTTSGSANLESVGRVEVAASSGSVEIGTVTEWADIGTSSGSVRVRRHAGHVARVRASSGSVALTIAPEATGNVQVRTSSGSVTLHGSHRSGITVAAKASSGYVRRL